MVSRASGAVKWAALGSLLPRFVTPVSTMILAAMLTPSDFGLVAAATAVVAVAQIVIEMGMGAAIIQRRSEVAEVASMALEFSVAVGGGLYFCLWLLAPWFATLYKVTELAAVLRVAGVTLILSALISIPSALLTRELEFRRLFWIATLPQIVNALVALSLALAGARYWALIAGIVASRVVNLILVWRACRWRPKLVLNPELFRTLITFSVWVFVSGLQSWLFLYADNLLAGHFYGVYNLGVYSLGFNLANLLPAMLTAPLAAVAYPAFSALQEDSHLVGRSLLKLQRLAAAILFPACFGLAALAGPIVTLLYVDKWNGLGWTLSFLAVMPGLSNLWSLNADAYRAVGHPDVWVKVAGAALMVLFLLLFLGSQFGYRAFVVARFVGAFSLPLFNIWAARRFLQIPLREQWHSWRAPCICAIMMSAVVLGFSLHAGPFQGIVGAVKILSLVGLGCAIYVGGLWFTDRDLFRQLLSSLALLAPNRWG